MITDKDDNINPKEPFLRPPAGARQDQNGELRPPQPPASATGEALLRTSEHLSDKARSPNLLRRTFDAPRKRIEDTHGRRVSYLRFSVTDRCNLRCRYCRSPMDKDIPHDRVLRYEEILDLVGLARDLGVEKVRLTGGEPFVRKGFMDFLRRLRGPYPDLDVRVTTNATLARPHVAELKELGLNGVNISLDSFKRENFAAITGQDALPEVLRCVEAFIAAGIRLKINAVAMRGVNDFELGDFVAFARDNPVDVRFIEFMPMGAYTPWTVDKFWPADDILAAARQMAELSPARQESHTRGPAKLYDIVGGKGRLGFITPLSDHFCGSCNRLRITSDGNLRTCLFADREYRLRPALRHPALGLEAVRRIMELAGKCKPVGADILENKRRIGVAQKHMNGIGG